jgi:hypothetical protein
MALRNGKTKCQKCELEVAKTMLAFWRGWNRFFRGERQRQWPLAGANRSGHLAIHLQMICINITTF